MALAAPMETLWGLLGKNSGDFQVLSRTGRPFSALLCHLGNSVTDKVIDSTNDSIKKQINEYTFPPFWPGRFHEHHRFLLERLRAT
jgi:hypothetical protein